MSNRIICIIPARYGSTRLHGKPLCEVRGLPLVMWAYRSAERARVFEKIIVATDDERIRDAVEKHGGIAVMTSRHHASGTDRVCEAAMNEPCEYVVNLQGDEPDLPAGLLADFVEKLREADDKTLLTTASYATISEIENPDVVKVVLDARERALYFSRSIIPFDREKGEGRFLRHCGIYGFTRRGLQRFCSLPQGVLEKREHLEQLRALEFGMTVRCLVRDHASCGIDTPEDLAAFRAHVEQTYGKTGSYSNREDASPDR
ncbi:MAG: 3-deoxy-manno-octulosonate cytidylyltransferase [Chitinispirillaceae bacterium]|nr:3-deoxy-manno-octulosonate cytidylyltransferase [Chitinispirillaceae bacterium]